MAATPKIFDLEINDTSETTGTGTITLDDPATNRTAVAAVVPTGALTTFLLWNGVTGDWEISSGVVTITAGVATFARSTIIASSNGGAAVNFTAGTMSVSNFMPPKFVLGAQLNKLGLV